MNNLDVSAIHIIPHAIDRFRERTKSKHSNEKIEEKLRQMLSTAVEMQLKKKYAVIALLNHHLKPARYFKTNNGQIFVIVDNTLSTIHNGTANRWEPAK